jgi:hypothetical protein
VIVAIIGLGLAAASAGAEPVAGRLTTENFAARRVGGPDADAGAGDWFLGNGTLCAAISDPAHESPLVPTGGVLIDLGHCGADDDQWTVLQPLLNLSQSHLVPVSEIESGSDGARAWIRTRSVVEGVEIVTTYAVGDAEANVLDVTLRAKRVAAGDSLFSIGTVLLHPSGQTPPFSLLRRDLTQSRGFAYPENDRHSVFSLLNALIASDLTVLVGGDGMPPISYGVERVSTRLDGADGVEPRPLGSFSVTGMHFTSFNSMTDTPWLGSADVAPGLLEMVQLPFMDVAEDRTFVSRSRIRLGRRADVAAITDQVWPDAPRVRGTVDVPNARIHVDLEGGAPVTQVHPEADGRFALRLPPGRYVARVVAPAEPSTTVPFVVEAETEEIALAPITLGTPGWVRLPRDFVGRLVFLRADGSGPVRFGADGLDFRIGEMDVPSGIEAPWLNLAASPQDPERVPLPPGRYRVVAVRGPEYEAIQRDLEVRAGATHALALPPLARIAPTPGWIAADLHVHSGESFDSSVPQVRQVVAFAASGAEVLVATEHDRVFDPRPAIARSGQSERLVGVTGVEMTSAYEGGDTPYSTGHLNAFPMVPDPSAYRGGAPSLEGRRLRDVLADLRGLASPPFVQLNHPRADPGTTADDTFFDRLGVVGDPLEPARTLDTFPNAVLVEPSPRHGGRDLDFHGMELMNGPSLPRYRRVRADWLSLLLQGESIVGTANSDSHRLGVVVGLPRTYVAVDDDALDAFDEPAFVASLRAGRAFGSTGPIVEARLDDAGPGEMHAGGTGTLSVSVDAAPWVPIGEWRVYVDGTLVHRAPIARGETAQLPLVFADDALVTVEVEGPAEGLYRDALPGFVPFAFTNPIRVDADGDGHFRAPGLPSPRPVTLASPDEAP